MTKPTHTHANTNTEHLVPKKCVRKLIHAIIASLLFCVNNTDTEDARDPFSPENPIAIVLPCAFQMVR